MADRAHRLGTGFQIVPAIDLKGGKCVRLRQGMADDATVYSTDPVAMARHWVDQGADILHVVDLDGAFEGRPVHGDLIGRIVKAAGVPVEVGGGLRTDEQIADMLRMGVARVVVGTRMLEDPSSFARLVSRHGDRLVAGIDARNGMVQVRGWKETTSMTAGRLAERAADAGISRIIYTDTARDGMLDGVNLDAVRSICDGVRCRIVASGGVKSVADIESLIALKCANLEGVIVGKALYDGAVTLKQLLEAAGERKPSR